ncbi:MAG: hypothetical protein H6744_01205 [Deltaproteobacteria bacterium]|nr:hypothetical protein [Deltaproteobacteria bacterium]
MPGCLIDATCHPAGAEKPGDACQLCDPERSADAWVPMACDDDDACTGPDTCVEGTCEHPVLQCPEDGNPCTTATCDSAAGCGQEPTAAVPCADPAVCVASGVCTDGVCVGPKPVEKCGDGVDNDCDGVTDGVPPDCSKLGQPCSFHADCNPEGVCAHHGLADKKLCSAPCAGADDCAEGEICTKLAGSAQIGYCEPAVGSKPDGQSCASSFDCASRSCIAGVCRSSCLHQDVCTSAGQSCALAGSAQHIAPVCRPPGSLTPVGQSCDPFGLGIAPDPTTCSTGFCDELYDLDTRCSNLCRTRDDCGAGQKCDLVAVSQQTSTATTAFSAAVQGPFYSGAFACYTPKVPLGTRPDADVCTGDGDCASGHCIALVPDDATRYCTRFCTTDDQCAPSMICRMDSLLAISEWLTANGTADASKATLVRVCRFP